MSRAPKKRTTHANLIISLVIHGLLVTIFLIWAAKTGRLEKAMRIMGVIPQKREQAKTDAKEEPPKQLPPKLPPINTGAAPSASSGTRRAVASDAPAAAGGGSFFQDTRQQVQGPGAGTGGGAAAKAPAAAPPPPAPPPLVSGPRLISAPPPSTIKTLMAERSKAAALTESFGSEQISKSSVSDAGDIVTKVAGASVVGGKYAVIRGLSERYISTTVNGAEIPSADPYKKSAPLDLFPSQIIDQVMISKSFTPDQPGSFTGGGINIVTRSFPSRPFFSLSVGTSYNTVATFNPDFLSYDGGGLDWLAMDDGTRALPGLLADEHLTIPNPVFTTGNRPAGPPNPQHSYYQALREAERLDQLTKAAGVTQFAPVKSQAPLDRSFSLAGGDTVFLWKKPLGYFFGLNYKQDFRFAEEAVKRRYGPAGTPGSFEVTQDYVDSQGVSEASWAAVANLTYQLHEHHQLGFNMLYNQSAEDMARRQAGVNSYYPDALFYHNRLHFTERNLQTYQLRGSHLFPELGGLKMDWLGALSYTSQEEPDTRFFNYADVGGSYDLGVSGTPDPLNPTRYFRDLQEENKNFKVDWTLPFRPWSHLEGQFKFGLFDSLSDRTFVDREIYYNKEAGDFGQSGDPNSFLTPDNLGMIAVTNQATGRVRYSWPRYIATRNSRYTGNQEINAAYFMFDLPVASSLRLIAGARVETTDLNVQSESYLLNSITGQATNSTSLEQVHVLPSVGLVYQLRTNMNLRFSYGQTLSRPAFRELAGYRSYDPTLDELLEGNSQLKITDIQNFDLRWEWFVRPGELLAVSLFYKDLQNAIERKYIDVQGNIISFENRPEAKVYGIEFEARKNLDFVSYLLGNFSLGGNLSLIQSEVPLTEAEYATKVQYLPDLSKNRPLYDQSPYLLNLDLTYENPRRGFTASLIYSIFGPRISIASLTTEDIYEQPAPYLDLVLSQRIGRNLKIKFSAKNLLDPRVERSYGEDGARLFSSYRRGRTFGLSLSYDF